MQCRSKTIPSESMEPTREYYYDINRRYLSWVGQWPYQKPKERLFIMTFFIIIISSVIFPQIAQFCICDNMQCIFQTLPPYMLALMILIKLFTYQFNSQKIKNLTHRLFAHWDTLETQEDCEIMKKYAENGRWYSLLYGSYVYVSTISFLTTCLVPRVLDVVFPLNSSRPIKLVFPVYYFVDEERYFYYIFCHILICSTLCLTGLIAHDTMFFTYIEHVCGLFAVVGFKFEHLLCKHNNAKKSLINCSDTVHCKNVAFLVHAHKEALQFATLLENVFTMSFVVQIFIVTTGLSISLLQISSQLHDLVEAMRYIVFVIAQLFHLFCLSFQGQKLIDHSLDVRNKIFNCSWYKMPVKAQKLLVIVMRRSIEASTVTAGKIYVFSLQNFTTIVQSSVSYFTMLSSFSEP